MEERIWRDSTKSYQRFFARSIGVSNRCKSQALKRVLSDFGAEHSFAAASRSVQEHYGFELHPSAVRQATLEASQRAQEALEKKYDAPYRVLPAQGKEWIIAEADGTLVRTVESVKRGSKRPQHWKEMRLTAAVAQGSCQKVYGATFEAVDEVGRRLGHCARDAGWGLNSHIHVVADGAEWIRNQSQIVFGDQNHALCDFFHVSQYVAAAAKVIAPQRSDSWRRVQQKRLKRGALQLVIDQLHACCEPEDPSVQETPVRDAWRYLTNRRDILDYKSALENNLPIGSGIIESGHRHVLQARLKKPGAFWLPENAEALAQLRVLRANLQWESLWN